MKKRKDKNIRRRMIAAVIAGILVVIMLFSAVAPFLYRLG